MKKLIILFCFFILVVGCGKKKDEVILQDESITSETSSEETTYDFDIYEEESTEFDKEFDEDDFDEDDRDGEDLNKAESVTEVVTEKKESGNLTKAQNELESYAKNAKINMECDGSDVDFKVYITDDTIDYIKAKDKDYASRWNENCGLYEEFLAGAIRILEKNGVSNYDVDFEIVGRSDNKVYFKNENGNRVYDAYVE